MYTSAQQRALALAERLDAQTKEAQKLAERLALAQVRADDALVASQPVNATQLVIVRVLGFVAFTLQVASITFRQ